MFYLIFFFFSFSDISTAKVGKIGKKWEIMVSVACDVVTVALAFLGAWCLFCFLKDTLVVLLQTVRGHLAPYLLAGYEESTVKRFGEWARTCALSIHTHFTLYRTQTQFYLQFMISFEKNPVHKCTNCMIILSISNRLIIS